MLLYLPVTALLLGALTAAPLPATAQDGGVCDPGGFPAHWISGGPDCGSEPEVQVHAYNDDFYILRQSLCTHYEAPFLYLIFGDERALLLDTGSALPFDMYEHVKRIVDAWKLAHGVADYQLLVGHTHAHGDHIGGDAQFVGKPGVRLIEPGLASNVQFFGFTNWPNDIVSYDLGNRVLDLIPIPGHEESSIAFYDRRTCILLTGDSLYPGRLYIPGARSMGQWSVYKSSVQRLVDFTAVNQVSWVLGCHIEMTLRPGVDYPFLVDWHPFEHELQLGLDDLLMLDKVLDLAGDAIKIYELRDFIVYPIN